MNTRERFQKVMHFEKADLLPFCEFLDYWGDTINRWYSEGLPWGVDVCARAEARNRRIEVSLMLS